MPDFIVKRGKIGRDGKVYKPGDRITLAQEIADVLPQGRVEPVAGPAKTEELLIAPEEPGTETTPAETKGPVKKKK